MATSRASGFDVTETIWNAVLSSINDAGTIWSGAVASPSTVSAVTSLSIGSAVDNGGVFINASGTNRPVVSFGNTTTGALALIQATNDKGLVFYANGNAEQVMKLHASGGVSIGGTTAPPDGCLAVEAGAIYLPDSGAADGINIFGAGGSANSAIHLYGGARGTGAITGSSVSIGRNSSGGGAPGVLVLYAKNGTAYYLWVDTTGDLRIGTAAPEEDGTPSDISGDVVGGQS